MTAITRKERQIPNKGLETRNGPLLLGSLLEKVNHQSFFRLSIICLRNIVALSCSCAEHLNLNIKEWFPDDLNIYVMINLNDFITHNKFHILRLFDVLPNFPFTTSETMGDYYS